MPSLSHSAREAGRLLRKIPDVRRAALQEALVALCEEHWRELRSLRPATALAATLWAVTPPWSDLLLDLHAAADARLDDLVPPLDLATALALLVMAEIERGNEAGVHIAHEPMMAFEKSPPPAAWLERVSALLRGTLVPPPLHPHARREPIWKALAVIAAQTRRVDLPAVLAAVGLLTAAPATGPRDTAVDALRAELDGIANPGRGRTTLTN